MKVNKITAIVCMLMSFISGVLLFFYKDNVILQSILSGIFTGFIVSFVVAVIGYFHERAKIMEAVGENIKSLFLNISVMSMILGNVLPQIHNSVAIQDLPFRNIYSLSCLNSEFIEKMNLGLYSPVFSKSGKSVVCKNLKVFRQTTNNLKNCSSNITIQVSKYNILILDIQKDRMMGTPTNPVQEKKIDDLKNLINISTAKFHEYTTAQSLEIGKIAENFFGDKSWKECKVGLLKEAENIVSGY